MWPFRRRGRKAQHQADELVELMLARLARAGLENDEAAVTFVTSRFRDRMVTHLSMAPLHGLAFSALSVISIAGGVAVSSLAAGADPNDTVVVVLGLVIAAATAINQIWKFGQRSAVRFRAGNALRQEAWDFVAGRGRYTGAGDKDAFDLFYDAVWKIERPADEIVEVSAETNQQR